LCETIPFKDIEKIIDDTLIKDESKNSKIEKSTERGIS